MQLTKEITEKKSGGVRRWFKICPVRHLTLLAGLLFIIAFAALRSNTALMEGISNAIARPYHALAGRVFSGVNFPVAELLYAVVIILALAYLIRAAILLARGDARIKRAYLSVITVLSAIIFLYALLCLLWGVCYYADSFSDKSGISAEPVSTEKLAEVTAYFADAANAYAPFVGRDDSGSFSEDEEEIFTRSLTLFREVESEFPCLAGPELRPKSLYFSYIMSYMNFTGFFFPFTGEIILNTDSPQSFLPATIAHELAHQRGVPAEDEANFVGILACMKSGDAVFCYSAALMAYTYLSNALHEADPDAWREVYAALDEDVRNDLNENRTFWSSHDTKAAKASEAVYTGFLQGYGQELGVQSYGACVDLLVAYYCDAAEALAR